MCAPCSSVSAQVYGCISADMHEYAYVIQLRQRLVDVHLQMYMSMRM